MKKALYLSAISSIILGSVVGIPLKGSAETNTYDSDSTISTSSEPIPSASSVNSIHSTSSEAEAAPSTSTSASSESTTVIPSAETSSTTNTVEARAASLDTWMPDPVLQQIVAKAIGKTKDTLTQEDMPKLTSLFIQNTDTALASLKGLELAGNLEYFYMNSNNQISDFSVLASLPKLKQVYLMGTNVTDQNVPIFGPVLTQLNLSGSSVTNNVYDKITKMTNLESLTFESNMNITTIEPVIALTKLKELRVQFCGITDFKPINQMPALTQLAAYGQNTGRGDAATPINADQLNYDADKQTIYIPFSIMPNRMTNFDGYVPPFTTSNSASQTYFDFNGGQLDSSRLAITDEGVTVSGVTQEEFDQLQTFKYNARLNNPAGTYNQPERFTFYAISAGTYLHQFTVQHTTLSPGLIIKYVDESGDRIRENQTITGNVGESYDTTTENYQLTIPGYSLDQDQLPSNATGELTADPQTVTYVYKRNSAILNAHDSTIYVGDAWKFEDNFDGGTDPYGQPITINDVQTEGSVDNTKVGKYKITYTYNRVPNRSWTGDHAEATATVTVIDPEKEAKPVTIKYLDPKGKEIHAKKVLTGKIGAAFDVSGKEYQPTIKNYTLDKKQLPKNAKGSFSDQAQTVIYVYQPVMTPATETSEPSGTTSSSVDTTATTTTDTHSTGGITDSSKGTVKPAGGSINTKRQTTATKNAAAKLPKTGEAITPKYLIAGTSMLLLAAALLVFSRKRIK
ncbi:MucBP domain-containing protein [Enterococcus sp. AZ196]|uniref:MucBP domain-containing protein n=1 Tax=Enterococcus sp. AZ196 TaxID=2774659 RepID=UPI003D26EF28